MNNETPNDVPHSHGPASFLLPEILEEIFLLAQSSPDLPQNELLCSPINVSQVSKHWRNVAIWLPGLWTNIKAVTNSKSVMCHAKRLILVELFLSRCGSILPLDISISTNPFSNGSPSTPRRRTAASSMCQYINLVKPVRHRWRKIHLDFMIATPARLFPGVWPWVFDNMPMLEKLQITYPTVRNKKETGTIDLSASRRLKACYVVGCVRMNIAEEITLPNLKYLGFEVASNSDEGLVANWLRVLRRAPNLMHLAVTIRPGLKWCNHSGLINLPNLRYLKIIYPEEVENSRDELQYAFLNSLSCPKLKELAFVCIYSKGPRQRDGFNIQGEDSGPSRFLKASGCSLERLRIEYDLFDELELERTLALCPDLQTLHFRNMRFAENSALLDNFHLERTIGEGELLNGQEFVLLCPKLKALIVDRCYIPPCITTSKIANMLAYTWLCEGSELVHFSFTDCGLNGFDQHPWIQEMRGSRRFRKAQA